MTDVAIRVENLCKQYRIGATQARYKTLRESLVEAVLIALFGLWCSRLVERFLADVVWCEDIIHQVVDL